MRKYKKIINYSCNILIQECTETIIIIKDVINMRLINITIIIQIFILVICIKEYLKLKKIKDKNLYYHQKQSFDDAYRGNALFLLCNIIYTYFTSNILFDSYGLIMGIMVWILGPVIEIAVTFVSLYMATEIKHLSPNDGIGRQLLDFKNKKVKKSADRFYLEEVIVGMLSCITLLIQSACIHPINSIIIIFVGIFLYYFGMADILQHENYNSPEYVARYKKMKWQERFYITNIVKYYNDKEYHDRALSVFRENNDNIKIGFKNTIKIINNEF